MAPGKGGIVIFSGGSAANSLVDVFESVRKSRGCSLSYIIPISDNGGSSSELIRVFGGPGIGDVRSRLVRLIPFEPYSAEREAIRALLSSRLSSVNGDEARIEWSAIVDGTSVFWRGIPSAKKELIRSFLNSVNLEILKRSRPPTSTFDFRSASIGNLFLTGARLFSGSFESAIYLLSSVCGIPDEQIKVIPSINSNFSHHIAAELEDGTVILGQNSISHPSLTGPGIVQPAAPILSGDMASDQPAFSTNVMSALQDANGIEMLAEEEDAHPPFTLPSLRTNNVVFTKSADELEDLPSRINRVHYVNSFGQEILPPANPRALQAVTEAQAIIYSIGSLYTSIVPNLVLRGIGEAMRRSQAQIKILILNGCLDREVGPCEAKSPFTAADFVEAIVKAGERSRGIVWMPQDRLLDSHQQETDMKVSTSLSIRPALQRAHSEGITLRLGEQKQFINALPSPPLASTMPSRAGSPTRSPERASARTPITNASSRSSSKPSDTYRHYVTHIVHLPNADGTPYVNQDLLATRYGIKCIRVYGRRNASGPGMLYDPLALRGAIEAVIGGRVEQTTGHSKDDNFKTMDRERGRRYTVDR